MLRFACLVAWIVLTSGSVEAQTKKGAILNGFLELAMSIAQAPKLELQSSSPLLMVMHCT